MCRMSFVIEQLEFGIKCLIVISMTNRFVLAEETYSKLPSSLFCAIIRNSLFLKGLRNQWPSVSMSVDVFPVTESLNKCVWQERMVIVLDLWGLCSIYLGLFFSFCFCFVEWFIP